MMKRRAVRITVGFFAIMLALTFCSRTIYRGTLVIVKTCLPTGGTLKYTIEADEFDFCADSYVTEYIPFALERPLTVCDVLLEPGDAIVAGDALVSLYAPEGERLLAQAEAELLAAREACAQWDVDLAEADVLLTQRSTQALTPDELGLLNAQRELLAAGILNGNSTRKVYQTFKSAQALVDYLRRLHEDAWTIRAGASGTLCAMAVDSGSKYSGISPICRIARDDSVFLKVRLSDAPDMRHGDWKITAYVDTNAGLVEAEVRSSDAQDVRVNMPQGVSASDVISTVIKLESPYQQYLAPNVAIHDDKVYLLENDVGAWGQSVYSVREVSVITGDSDLQRTAVVEGISRNDRLIVSATDSLTDGQIVLIDGYE